MDVLGRWTFILNRWIFMLGKWTFMLGRLSSVVGGWSYIIGKGVMTVISDGSGYYNRFHLFHSV